MFLPQREPGKKGLRAWGSDQANMNPGAYNHPVLILTEPDENGYVVVQKVSSPVFYRV